MRLSCQFSQLKLKKKIKNKFYWDEINTSTIKPRLVVKNDNDDDNYDNVNDTDDDDNKDWLQTIYSWLEPSLSRTSL